MASLAALYKLALAAGLPVDPAKIAAAIAMAESGGVAKETHDADDDSYGYWQINVKGADNYKAHVTDQGLTSPSQLLDPKTNAKVMAAISHNGSDFSPWSTYTSGKWKKFDKLNAEVQKPTGQIAIEAVADPAKQALAILEKAGSWLSNPSNWLRVGYVAGGGTLVIVAIVYVIKSSSAGQTAIKAGKTAVKTGVKVAAL
jgi:hypothetical protein